MFRIQVWTKSPLSFPTKNSSEAANGLWGFPSYNMAFSLMFNLQSYKGFYESGTHKTQFSQWLL